LRIPLFIIVQSLHGAVAIALTEHVAHIFSYPPGFAVPPDHPDLLAFVVEYLQLVHVEGSSRKMNFAEEKQEAPAGFFPAKASGQTSTLQE
jgi:hypothetical protein